jgi:hypothetical protein
VDLCRGRRSPKASRSAILRKRCHRMGIVRFPERTFATADRAKLCLFQRMQRGRFLLPPDWPCRHGRAGARPRLRARRERSGRSLHTDCGNWLIHGLPSPAGGFLPAGWPECRWANRGRAGAPRSQLGHSMPRRAAVYSDAQFRSTIERSPVASAASSIGPRQPRARTMRACRR